MSGSAPDLATLYRNDRVGEFTVLIDVSGTIREEVQASTEAEARAKVLAMIKANELDASCDDFDDIRITSVRPNPPMYLVMRDGRQMAVSHPQPGDLPREPGFAYELAKYTVAPTAKTSGEAS